jgi:predicted nucleotidyltransferase
MRPSEKLEPHRGRIRDIVLANGAANPRVFGSVLAGADGLDSDLDLLIEPGPRTSLFALARIKLAIEELLGVPVDVATPSSLPLRSRDRILREARPI